MDYKDYYEILAVQHTSSAEDIGKAYRKLARKYHPDVNPGDEEAAQRYDAINEAHLVLTTPDARAKYDKLSAAWQTKQEQDSSEKFNWQPWLAKNLVDSDDNTELDFFDALFGDMDVGQQRSSPVKGPDYHQQVEISLEEAYSGASRILRVGNRRLEVKIPRGAQTGTKVRVRNEGGASANNGPKGDLYLEIVVAPHPHFQRVDDDLHLEMPVNLYSAVLGGEAIVPTLKGKIKLRIPAETQSGKVFRLKGQGMPSLQNAEQRGDLYAKVMIVVPEGLTEEEIELFEELADIRGL